MRALALSFSFLIYCFGVSAYEIANDRTDKALGALIDQTGEARDGLAALRRVDNLLRRSVDESKDAECSNDGISNGGSSSRSNSDSVNKLLSMALTATLEVAK